MKPVLVSHNAYQSFVMDQLQKHYSGGILTLVNKDWPAKRWITDLSEITTLLADFYEKKDHHLGIQLP